MHQVLRVNLQKVNLGEVQEHSTFHTLSLCLLFSKLEVHSQAAVGALSQADNLDFYVELDPC